MAGEPGSGHVLRSWNVQKRLSHSEPCGSEGPEPGAREALVRVTDEQGAPCLSGTVQRRDLHLGLHPPPAAPSPLPCPARGSEDPLSQQSCLACTHPLPLRGALGLDPSYQGSAGCELDLAPVPCCARHSPGQRCEGLSLRPSLHFLLRATCPWLTSVMGSSLAAHRTLK